MKNLVCLNGEFFSASEAKISIFDQGVLYGAGLFETIKVSGGNPVRADLHISRLVSSAEALYLELPYKRDNIIQMLDSTAEINNMTEGALRLTITRGGFYSKPMLFITSRDLPYSERAFIEGIKAGFSSVKINKESLLIRHKTLNYFENIIARQQAVENGWDEAILLNTEGYITEGSVSNIFLIKNGRVITPGSDCGLLPGIIRGLTIKHCLSIGKLPEERKVTTDELLTADEVFITNSLIGVLPVVSVNNTLIGDGKPGRVTLKMMSADIFN